MSLTSLSWGEAQSRYTRSLCLWSALWFKAGLSFWSMQVTKAHSQSLLEDMVTVALSCFTWKEEDVQSLARLYGGKITAPSGWEHRAGGFRQLRDTQRQMATSLRVNGSAQGVRIRQLFSPKCGASDTHRGAGSQLYWRCAAAPPRTILGKRSNNFYNQQQIFERDKWYLVNLLAWVL